MIRKEDADAQIEINYDLSGDTDNEKDSLLGKDYVYKRSSSMSKRDRARSQRSKTKNCTIELNQSLYTDSSFPDEEEKTSDDFQDD